MKESDLGAYVVEWLENKGWDVYQEVMPKGTSRVCDIVAVKDGKVWAIECKRGFGFPVLVQANKWRADYRSVAVLAPRKKHMDPIVRACAEEYFKCGIIYVKEGRYDGNYKVLEKAKAPKRVYRKPWDKKLKHNLISSLRPEHKTYAKAGSAQGGAWTPYKGTMARVETYVDQNPGCGVGAIVEALEGSWHYRTKKVSSVKRYIRDSLITIEDRKWCMYLYNSDVREYEFYHYGAHSKLKRG